MCGLQWHHVVNVDVRGLRDDCSVNGPFQEPVNTVQPPEAAVNVTMVVDFAMSTSARVSWQSLSASIQ